MRDPVQNLSGHKRKVGNVRWHPTANNVLATSSTDYTVKVWDVEKGAAKCHVDGHADIIQSIDWNYEGSLIATACKDKKIRIIDPRTGQVVSVRSHPSNPSTLINPPQSKLMPGWLTVWSVLSLYTSRKPPLTPV